MKRNSLLLSIVTAIIIVLFVSVGVRNATSDVMGSLHDLTPSGASMIFNDYQVSEVCVFCHTPHSANTNLGYGANPMPGGGGEGSMSWSTGQFALNGSYLWNRRLPNRSFDTYANSSTMNHSVNQPGTLSLLCLSCHDGVGAVNVLLNYPAEALATPLPAFPGAVQIGNAASPDAGINIGDATCSDAMGGACTGGLDLRNDHPIGFQLDSSLITADGGLKQLSDPSFPAALKKRMEITGNRMECSSCHDPHKTDFGMFLVMDNAGSELCFGCHNK